MKNNIAGRRSDIGMNQEELAVAASVSRPHLSEIENDKAEPGGEVMLRIANALGVRLRTFFLLLALFIHNKASKQSRIFT